MTVDMPEEQASRAGGAETDAGDKFARAVVGVFLAALALFLGLPSLLVTCALSGTNRGTALDQERARRVVADQAQTLARVLALAERSPLPRTDDPECRSLAAELDALDIRFEAMPDGPWVRIVYDRRGIAETYETQLAWVPEESASRIRAGRGRLGESFTYIDRGWWWVFW